MIPAAPDAPPIFTSLWLSCSRAASSLSFYFCGVVRILPLDGELARCVPRPLAGGYAEADLPDIKVNVLAARAAPELVGCGELASRFMPINNDRGFGSGRELRDGGHERIPSTPVRWSASQGVLAGPVCVLSAATHNRMYVADSKLEIDGGQGRS